MEKCLDIAEQYIKNDGICDIICELFTAKLQNFMNAPHNYFC